MEWDWFGNNNNELLTPGNVIANEVSSGSSFFSFCIVTPSTLKDISKLESIISLSEIFVNITKPSIYSPVSNLPKALFNWNKFSTPI